MMKVRMTKKSRTAQKMDLIHSQSSFLAGSASPPLLFPAAVPAGAPRGGELAVAAPPSWAARPYAHLRLRELDTLGGIS